MLSKRLCFVLLNNINNVEISEHILVSSLKLKNFSTFRFPITSQDKSLVLKPIKHLASSFFCTSTSLPSNPSNLKYEPGVSKIQETIQVEQLSGLCILKLPLFSRLEYCRFTLKPLMHTLNDFFLHIKAEDPGIESIKAFTEKGLQIANNTSCGTLLKENFILQLNGFNFLIDLSGQDFIPSFPPKDATKDLIAQLYMTLHSDEIYLKRQEKLLQRLEELQYELEPMQKNLLDMKDLASKKSRIFGWGGLGLMGIQFGFLARLTWWEYSWDIMEPVTYFVTYGTLIAMFAYYLVTKEEYLYPTVSNRQILNQIYKISSKSSFDINKYNSLCNEEKNILNELSRLKNPIHLRLRPPYLPQYENKE